MKIRLSTLVLTLILLTVGCHSQTVEVEVSEENGGKLANIPISVWFAGISGSGSDDVEVKGLTDRQGTFLARGKALNSIAIFIDTADWYEFRRTRLDPRIDHKVAISLRRKIKPVSLFVRELTLEIPSFDEDLEFDLERGEWLPPYGVGIVSDLVINFEQEFKGMNYAGERLERAKEVSKRGAASRNEVWTQELFEQRSGRWDAKVSLSIKDESGGFSAKVKNILPHSEMKMPHFAPENGYPNKTIQLTGSTYKQASEPALTCYFFRSRIELKDNQVESANYGKILGDIKIDARGKMKFLYYYNPRRNDRNLEFDPKQNLAKDQERSYGP